MEKRVFVECPSQCRGTSCDHTNQEFKPRACTTDSGTVPGPQIRLSDSTGSGMAARGVWSHPRVEAPVLRLRLKPLALRTTYAIQTPKKRALRSSRCRYSPCIHCNGHKKELGTAKTDQLQSLKQGIGQSVASKTSCGETGTPFPP